MKSRQLIWLLLIYCSLNLPQVSYASNLTNTTAKKVFILLRTEQQPDVLENFKSQVRNNLIYNNIESRIESYRVSDALPQMKIFKTAYQEDFDYILLIDQIENYNVGLSNRKIHVGGKFKIQSYNLKSQEPSWTNHGSKNCNVSVEQSINAFSKEILNTIISENTSNFIVHRVDQSAEPIVLTKAENNLQDKPLKELVIPEYKLNEIKLLNTQIEYQKTKTEYVLLQIELLHLKIKKLNDFGMKKSENLALQTERF